MRKIRLGVLALTSLALGTACSDDEGTGPALKTSFAATLTGAAERPNPVTTTATGTGTLTLNDAAQTITYSVSVTNLVGITMAHLHTGATAEAGPIVINTLPTPPVASPFTGVLASGTATVAVLLNGETYTTLAAKIRAGTAYFNVHTVTNAGGEIRGQLVAQ